MPKKPLITIVGVPNTGKSTLFNRILGQRKALIHSSPGMTRDIFQESFELNGKMYDIQDTGGFFLEKDVITREINRRIFEQAERSDLIIFLFDGRRDLLGYEKDLYLEVRKINPNILLVLNKVDHPGKIVIPDAYYRLKKDLILISAEHNIGVETLLEHISNHFKQESIINREESVTEIRVCLSGKPNVGKSSIINSLLKKDWSIVSPIPGTTRDSVNVRLNQKERIINLVDNAGIRKMKKVKESTESAAVIRAEKDIKNADIVFFVIDLSQKIDQNDMLIAQKIKDSARPAIIVGNKWDLVTNKEHGEKLAQSLRKRFNFLYFAPIIRVSAKTGKNIHLLLEKLEEIYPRLTEKPKTKKVIQAIRQILSEKRYVDTERHVFNPKYIFVESLRPFFIQFRTKTQCRLRKSDEIYLKHRIIQELDMEGIPVFFKMQAQEDPHRKKTTRLK